MAVGGRGVGALTLEIAGARVEVKSAAVFALDALPENVGRPELTAASLNRWKCGRC